MKVYNSAGERVFDAQLAVNNEGQLCTHAGFVEGGQGLDLPKMDVSFESQKEGLLVHVGLAGTEKRADILVEYDDVKALKEVPGKGLVSFALKAFR